MAPVTELHGVTERIPVQPAPSWVVELNLPGLRIRRRARKRRHLLGLGR